METILTVPANAEIKETMRHYYWYSDGILYSVVKKGTAQIVRVEDMKQILDAFASVAPGKKVCMITDVTTGNANSKQVREYVAKEFPKVISAFAMVSASPVGRVVASLFFALKPQPYPAKMFATEAEAKEWIKQYL